MDGKMHFYFVSENFKPKKKQNNFVKIIKNSTRNYYKNIQIPFFFKTIF